MLSSSGKTYKNFLLPPLSQSFILNLHSSMQFSQSVLMQLCAGKILNGLTGLKKKKKKKVLNNNSNSKEDFFLNLIQVTSVIPFIILPHKPYLIWHDSELWCQKYYGIFTFWPARQNMLLNPHLRIWFKIWRCSLVVICVMAFHNNFILHLLLDHKALQIILEHRNVFLFK